MITSADLERVQIVVDTEGNSSVHAAAWEYYKNVTVPSLRLFRVPFGVSVSNDLGVDYIAPGTLSTTLIQNRARKLNLYVLFLSSSSERVDAWFRLPFVLFDHVIVVDMYTHTHCHVTYTNELWCHIHNSRASECSPVMTVLNRYTLEWIDNVQQGAFGPKTNL